MKITTEQETITPKMADEWLTKHFDRIANGEYRQRKIYKSVKNKYTNDMRAGMWTETPEPIIFDENENLADGQHRLMAIKDSKTTQVMMVSRGWPAEVIDSINRGKVRMVSDQLHLHGTKNAIIVAASVSGIVRVCYRGLTPSVSYSVCTNLLDKLGMRTHIEKILEVSMAHGIKPTGRFVGPLAFYRSVKPRKADEFLDQIANMNTDKGSGSYLYAKYMRSNNASSQQAAIMAICACIRIWDAGETIDYFKSTVQACDWLANQNSKLYTSITDMLGDISDTK
jgi:hypothetical protein